MHVTLFNGTLSVEYHATAFLQKVQNALDFTRTRRHHGDPSSGINERDLKAKRCLKVVQVSLKVCGAVVLVIIGMFLLHPISLAPYGRCLKYGHGQSYILFIYPEWEWLILFRFLRRVQLHTTCENSLNVVAILYIVSIFHCHGCLSVCDDLMTVLRLTLKLKAHMALETDKGSCLLSCFVILKIFHFF